MHVTGVYVWCCTLEILPIVPALRSMLFDAHYADSYKLWEHNLLGTNNIRIASLHMYIV